MSVLFIIPNFYPAEIYGGPIQSSKLLCDELARLKYDVRVLTTDSNGAVNLTENERRRSYGNGYEVLFCRRLARNSISIEFVKECFSIAGKCKCLHVNALFNFTTLIAVGAARVHSVPVILSPRGGASIWSGSKRRLVKSLWCRLLNVLLPPGSAVHSTSEREALASKKYFGTLPCTIIPNVVPLPSQIGDVGNSESIRLVFIGRLHPVKGIDVLLRGLAEYKGSSPGARWMFVLVGEGDPHYKGHLRELIEQLGIGSNVSFAGFQSGEAKNQFLLKSDCLFLVSESENYGQSAAEALSYGVPVIVSRDTPWGDVEQSGCGFVVDRTPASIAGAMHRLAGSCLMSMSKAARAYAEQRFTAGIGRRYCELYEAVSRCGGS
jgi:glycosyltransferase involved in cell wall biosynthesis